MMRVGVEAIIGRRPWFRGAESYPIAAYSEFMPPPREVSKPYQGYAVNELDEDDPWGWPISEWEEARQLRPGLAARGRDGSAWAVRTGARPADTWFLQGQAGR